MHKNSVPKTRLSQVFTDHPELRRAGSIGVPNSLGGIELVFWDDSHRRLVSFREARQQFIGAWLGNLRKSVVGLCSGRHSKPLSNAMRKAGLPMASWLDRRSTRTAEVSGHARDRPLRQLTSSRRFGGNRNENAP